MYGNKSNSLAKDVLVIIICLPSIFLSTNQALCQALPFYLALTRDPQFLILNLLGMTATSELTKLTEETSQVCFV